MNIKEILEELQYNKGYFPYEAVKEAIAQKDEIMPYLLKILEDTERNIHRIKKQSNYIAHIYAMFLLAQFKEKKAYPLIISLFSHPGDTSYNIAGDFVFEGFPQVLASVCNGDTTLIEKLIEKREANEFIREAALSSLLILVVNGIKKREELIDYCKCLFRGKIERKPSVVWGELVYCSSCLCADELYEDIKKAYKDHLVDPFFLSLEDVDKYFFMGWEKNLKSHKNDKYYQLIEDTIKRMEWWACFQS